MKRSIIVAAVILSGACVCAHPREGDANPLFEVRRIVHGDGPSESLLYYSDVLQNPTRSQVAADVLADFSGISSARVVGPRKLRNGEEYYDIAVVLTDSGRATVQSLWAAEAARGTELALIVCGDLVVRFHPAAVPEEPFATGMGAFLSYEDATNRVRILNDAIKARRP